nr:uncharacterized protein LOC129384338 [Dermacentor andersoni]
MLQPNNFNQETSPEFRTRIMASHGCSADEGPDFEWKSPPDSKSLQGPAVDYEIPCTATHQRICHIVQYLPAWNKWLCYNQSQLRESTGKSGQFSLVACTAPVPTTPTVDKLHKRRKADIFLNWLLKTHRCVGEIDLTHWPPLSTAFDHSPDLLFDALSQNSSVKVLKLKSNNMNYRLCDAISSLVQIEEFEFEYAYDSFDRTPMPSALSSLLRTAQSLISLRIPELRFDEAQADEFLTALTTNKTLQALSIREIMSSHPLLLNRSAFAEFLKSTLTLTTLTITIPFSPPYQPARNHWLWILEGLLKNETIQNVSLAYVIVDVESSALITKIFAENKVIRTFEIISKRERLDAQYTSMSECWLRALAENNTLENIRVPISMWTLKQWKRFVCTMAKKKNMRTVTIGVTLADRPLLPELCNMLKETGAEEKVSLGWFSVGEERGILECKAISQLYAYKGQYAKAELCGILKLLPSLHHVKFLSLNIAVRDLDAGLYSAICEYITATSALEKLDLMLRSDGIEDNAGDPLMTALLESLSCNKSIKHLAIFVSHMQREQIELLADVILLSKSIRTVCYNAEISHNMDIFLRRLSIGIADNYQLLGVNSGSLSETQMQAFDDCYIVLEVTRRNSNLLTRAAAYVSGLRQDRCAACALDRVVHHAALPEEVGKVASVSEADASAMVRRAFAHLQGLDDYMRLSGVVRERVVCYPRDDESVQLDCLNDYCWAAVRRYLFIDDIKGSTLTWPCYY